MPITIKPTSGQDKDDLPELEEEQEVTSHKTIYVKPTLTKENKAFLDDEFKPTGSQIISSPMAERAHEGTHPVRTAFITIIILAALGAGGYKGFLWYQAKHARPVAAIPASPQVLDSFISTNGTTTPSNASSTPAGSSGMASSTPSSTTPSLIASTTPPAIPNAHELTVNKTSTGYLNVRSQPSSGSQQITQVHPGENYPYINTKNGWFQITLPNGHTGWVAGQFVTLK